MGQLQNQFQQMMGGRSPYSGGGQRQNRRVPWRPQTQQGSYSGQPISPQRGDQPRVNDPWSEFEPQKPQQPPMQRGIDQMPGRDYPTYPQELATLPVGVNPAAGQQMAPRPNIAQGVLQTGGFKPEKGQPQLSGPPMMPPTMQPPTTVPPGTGGIKPQREPVGPPVPSTTPPNPAQQRIDPSRVQASASGTMQGGSVSQPVGQMQSTPYQGPFQGYREMPGGRNPYRRGQGGGPRRDGGPESMG